MNDVVDPATRSRMMSGIRAKNTTPELTLRKLLHNRGFRFRLHRKDLPGTPDMVLPKYRAVIFTHGCFWHGHSCAYFRWPSSRPDFWRRKIERNQDHDSVVLDALLQLGWRVAVVWECALRNKTFPELRELGDSIDTWLIGDELFLELPVK